MAAITHPDVPTDPEAQKLFWECLQKSMPSVAGGADAIWKLQQMVKGGVSDEFLAKIHADLIERDPMAMAIFFGAIEHLRRKFKVRGYHDAAT